VLPLRWYRAFGLILALLATSTNMLFQPSDMSSVQASFLHSMKLECPNDLITCLVTLLRVKYLMFHFHHELQISQSAIPSAMSYLSPSLFLLVLLVSQSSLASHSTQILENVPVSYSALDAWPQSMDLALN
jgi:hypothetical protein